jgi:SSS family solute:Na+ symporter
LEKDNIEWSFLGLLSGKGSAALTYCLNTVEGKGGAIANLHTFYSGTSQAFNIAWIFFLICFTVTVLVSLFTKRKKDAQLVGLVYSLTSRVKDDNRVWYKNPLWLGILVLAITLII